jgi:hypothetical protein
MDPSIGSIGVFIVAAGAAGGAVLKVLNYVLPSRVDERSIHHLERVVQLLADMRSDARFDQSQMQHILEKLSEHLVRIERKLDDHIQDESEMIRELARTAFGGRGHGAD